MKFLATRQTVVKTFFSSEYQDEAAKEYHMWLRSELPVVLDVSMACDPEGFLILMVTYTMGERGE